MAISSLSSNSTFYDWYIKTNDIITEINLMNVYGVTSGDGILLTTNPVTKIATGVIGGTSGNIQSGLTFSGKVSFTGEVVVPNVSFKVTGITSGTLGYNFGSVIRLDGFGYTLAKANDPDNSEVLGVISSINPTYSVVTSLGRISGDFSTTAGGTLSPGCIYFLDPSDAGKITTSEPQTVGQVSKPIIMGISGDSGLVVQYRGNYLNGAGANLGMSGNNRIYIVLPAASASNGFTPGTFVSYLPDVGNFNAEFSTYLTNTSRIIYDGWFISQASSISNSSPMPLEEDFVVGMIETSADYGLNKIYQIVTKGASEVLPDGLMENTSLTGWWILGDENTVNQTTPSSNNITEQQTFERLYVGYNYNDSSFVVDIKPQIRSISAAQRSTQISSPKEFMGAIVNETFNGDFSVWQRTTAKNSQYTTNTTKMYFADQWVRRTSRTSLVTQTLQRQSFSKTQTSVEGSPEYYIDVKCLVDPSSLWIDGYHSIGHILPGIEKFNNENITISFYAKCTQINYNINVYFARYNGSTLVSKYTVGTIKPSSVNWTKYTFNYTVPTLASASYNDDYVEIGFDLEPMVKQAFNASVATGTNLVASFSSLSVYRGTYSNPKLLFETLETKQLKSKRYYVTTYSDSQTPGSQTLADDGSIAINSTVIQLNPSTQYSIQKFPTEMRAVPSVAIYSPDSGTQNDIFNITANVDLRQTSGTIGYDKKTRVSKLNTPTISVNSDKTAYKLTVLNGVVPYDTIGYHIIADASYPL